MAVERLIREENTRAAQAREYASRYSDVRLLTERHCEPLCPEDCVIQSMPDTSPTRWHLAHVTWFFETFVLSEGLPDYTPFRTDFSYLFNSYYNSIGQPFARPNRGLLSRPTVAEVFEYRRAVDQRMQEFLLESDPDRLAPLLPVVEIGLHHEQQHQELLLTDIKHVFSCNPLYPTYQERSTQAAPDLPAIDWSSYEESMVWIGHDGKGFAFDNESPRHKVWLDPFLLANRLSTNEEYLQFIEDDGYARPELWLSAGWNQVCEQGWRSPLYWVKQDDGWWNFTLSGLRPVAPDEPVCHVSFFEADAFARWSKARLPTESEWESAAQNLKIQGKFVEEAAFHPLPISDEASSGPAQVFGDVWEWTASDYSAYPGYQPLEGALGEYNGKFMCNQYVLRGGSCATPKSHIRRTYRNFFPTESRWQFSGIRLAR